MKVFNTEELASIQRSINDDYSFYGVINPEEDRWRSWYTEARGITSFQSKKNKPFWDMRCPGFGVEWKKNKFMFDSPEEVLGKRVGYVGSRVCALETIDVDARADMRRIAHRYNEIVKEFHDHCDGNAHHGIVIHSDDAVVYYETPAKTIDTEGLRAEWITASGKENLQVFNEAGQKVFTFLPNGNKLSVVIENPSSMDEVHYFKAEADVVWEPIPAGFYADFMARHPGQTFEQAMSGHCS